MCDVGKEIISASEKYNEVEIQLKFLFVDFY